MCNNIFGGTNWRECPKCGAKQNEKHWIDFREPSGLGDTCYYCEKCGYRWCPSCGEEIKIPKNAKMKKRNVTDKMIDDLLNVLTIESDHTYKEAENEISRAIEELKKIIDTNPTLRKRDFERQFKIRALKDSIRESIVSAVARTKLRGKQLKKEIKDDFLKNPYWKQRGITPKQFETAWKEIENEV